jgi:hypothetical protein
MLGCGRTAHLLFSKITHFSPIGRLEPSRFTFWVSMAVQLLLDTLRIRDVEKVISLLLGGVQ